MLIDLSPSLITFSRSRLLTKWESVVKDPFILRLISSFLDLPTLDNTGTDLSSKRVIPRGVPIFTEVLFNFNLDSLDRAFETRFPTFI